MARINSKILDRPQRALVLQGGGALGAYEVGAFEAICTKIVDENNESTENLFDIIAGTSIGALNAAIILSCIISGKDKGLNREQIAKKAVKKLHDFWTDLKATTIVENNNFFSNWWDSMHFANRFLATAEAARRYWSVIQYSFTPFGVPNLHFPVWMPDFRFLNILHPFWLAYDYSPLKATFRKNIANIFEGNVNRFPIKTDPDNREPRLLVVGVDVYDCSSAVTFDSYPRNGKWYSRYGSNNNLHRVEYDGIGMNELLASCLFPFATDHASIEDNEKAENVYKQKRIFWDGGFLSNTPLRELIQSHRDFWLKVKKKSVPDLEVYIINLYPPIEVGDKELTDYDGIMDRINDIQFHDKTVYDEKIAHIMTDYIDLVNEFKKNISPEQADKILQRPAKSISRDGTLRTYSDLVEGRFNVEVWRIDRQDDGDTIFGKHEDFSPHTIDLLIAAGKKDATISLNIIKILSSVRELLLKNKLVQEDADLLTNALNRTKLHITLNQMGLAKQDLEEKKISKIFEKAKLAEEKYKILNVINDINNTIS